MTLVEFLEANKDPSSSISLLSLAEFRNWMLLFGYWEGKQLRPIISQTRQQLEKLLLTTELVMPDSSDAAETASHVFKLTHRVTPLTAAPAVAEKMGHPASPLVSPHLAASDFVNEAMNKIRVAVLSHRPDAHQTAGLSPGSDYGRRLVESVIGPNAAPGAQPAPPAPPLPEPVGAEDREALAAITAEHDRLTAKAVQLYGLASPPVPLLNGLINELKRQIGNFEGQQQLVASRRDLAAFPAKLKFVLDDLGFDLRRCQALLMKAETQSQRGPIAASKMPVATPSAAPRPAPPMPPPVPQPDPAAVYKQHLAELNVAHAAEMKRRQLAFEKGQADHKAMVDMYQRQNDAWAKAFFSR